MDYNKLFVFGKSLFQPEYRILKEAFDRGFTKEEVLKLFENENLSPSDAINEFMNERSEKEIEVKFYESIEDVPDPRELDPNDKNLMIFDDSILEKQYKCECYYTRGRHSNVDCFYLTQDYFKLPRRTVRENANFFCLFKQDVKNESFLQR